jgi:hypothetical protein
MLLTRRSAFLSAQIFAAAGNSRDAAALWRI